MVKMNLANLKAIGHMVKVSAIKHSPEILLGTGTIAFVATVVTASKATIKAQDIFEDHKKKLDDINEVIDYCKQHPDDVDYSESDAKNDKVIAYVQTGIALTKDYAPAVGLAAISLTCFFAAFGIMRKRYVTLAAAYSALEKSFATYRQRVIADKGEDADTYYMTGVKPKEVTNKETKKKVKTLVLPDGSELASPYAFKFSKYKENGELNHQWQDDPNLNRMYVLGQQDWLNDQLYMRCVFNTNHDVVKRGCVFLNEARDILGEDATTSGAVTGWRYSNGEEGCNGYIDFNLIEATEIDPETDREIPCLIINPNVDGLIYDLVEKFENVPFTPSYAIEGE